jgi:hypothetical protein
MIIIGLLTVNTYLLWKVLTILRYMSLNPTNDDLWDIFAEYIESQDSEEDY